MAPRSIVRGPKVSSADFVSFHGGRSEGQVLSGYTPGDFTRPICDMVAMAIQNRSNAEHYKWGDACDGWRLLDNEDLSVIEERMPPGTAEVMHLHDRANQVFYVLEGMLTLLVGGEIERLSASDSLNVRSGTPHQARNESETDSVRFLVISAPTTKGDRRSA
ncbi:cupin domain-containing protein [Acidimangrovimonas sediminis]|uniref:cupin domain-containing protein n=1 Tax=Acidimangrovimonas sediminis TaxID=2056283 RepID=UPI001E31D645|nr:cupin domain-containing protein [Acidimangrovimonas sediminis]